MMKQALPQGRCNVFQVSCTLQITVQKLFTLIVKRQIEKHEQRRGEKQAGSR